MLRRVGIYGGVLLTAFLLGFLPMLFSARGYESERDAAQAELRSSILQNDLAASAIHARRGEYELARQQASKFFTDLRAELA